MLIHFIQHWLNLADLACEEATYDNASLRRFVGITRAAKLCRTPARSSMMVELGRYRREHGLPVLPSPAEDAPRCSCPSAGHASR
ncbi:hypothetical protein R69927_04165 [Paraburkholderia domus]|uniref:Transposase InsH N-terminal domain-containing protein n=1 Tax=Paraburkholderia domus TaxID=2793075 RepID=A0A9N8QWQ4_9BURK|nr:hypothetical protein R70006_04131 [Paraburkholderia domus]CAE6879639.1 hypothetical protein R69927_04165 [Paraburkholderia domus]CAE6887783.1 hypothetical protein R70211_02518 [Paraburkholderia domus]CAE6895186.1 hypothetical protein R75471_02627 [Paraburkholderia domus]CAE6895803.1 hypothetical protein R70199_03385 [Paraburkholderia domus]